MKTQSNFRSGANKILATVLFMVGGLSLSAVPASGQSQHVKNIILVHGAFVDGSGWRSVYEILTKKGYHVTVAQLPLTSLKADVDATNRILDKQDGPVILVGHSLGGLIITEAGMHPKVARLVYVAAFQLDKDENILQWLPAFPTAPESGVLPPDDKGFVYYDRAKFHAGFCADVNSADADFMFASQKPVAGQSFADKLSNIAWRSKPSYGIVALGDKTINPDLERKLYQRGNAKITEIQSSHAVFLSHPNEVAKVIMDAAEGK